MGGSSEPANRGQLDALTPAGLACKEEAPDGCCKQGPATHSLSLYSALYPAYPVSRASASVSPAPYLTSRYLSLFGGTPSRHPWRRLSSRFFFWQLMKTSPHEGVAGVARQISPEAATVEAKSAIAEHRKLFDSMDNAIDGLIFYVRTARLLQPAAPPALSPSSPLRPGLTAPRLPQIAAHSTHRDDGAERFQCVCTESGRLTRCDNEKLTPGHLKLPLGFKHVLLVRYTRFTFTLFLFLFSTCV